MERDAEGEDVPVDDLLAELMGEGEGGDREGDFRPTPEALQIDGVAPRQEGGELEALSSDGLGRRISSQNSMGAESTQVAAGNHSILEIEEIQSGVLEAEGIQSNLPETEEIQSNLPETEEIQSDGPKTEEIQSDVFKTEETPSTVPETEEIPSTVPETEKIPSTAPQIEKFPSTAPQTDKIPSIVPETEKNASPPGIRSPRLLDGTLSQGAQAAQSHVEAQSAQSHVWAQSAQSRVEARAAQSLGEAQSEQLSVEVKSAQSFAEASSTQCAKDVQLTRSPELVQSVQSTEDIQSIRLAEKVQLRQSEAEAMSPPLQTAMVDIGYADSAYSSSSSALQENTAGGTDALQDAAVRTSLSIKLDRSTPTVRMLKHSGSSNIGRSKLHTEKRTLQESAADISIAIPEDKNNPRSSYTSTVSHLSMREASTVEPLRRSSDTRQKDLSVIVESVEHEPRFLLKQRSRRRADNSALGKEDAGKTERTTRRIFPSFGSSSSPSTSTAFREITFFILIPFFFSLLHVLHSVLARCAVMRLATTHTSVDMSHAYQYLLRQSLPSHHRKFFFFGSNEIVDPVYHPALSDSMEQVIHGGRDSLDGLELPKVLLSGDIDPNRSARSLGNLIYEYNGIVAFSIKNNLTLVHRPLINLHGPERPSKDRNRPSGLGDVAEEFLQLGRGELLMPTVTNSALLVKELELPDSDHKAQFFIEKKLTEMKLQEEVTNASVIFVRPSVAGIRPSFATTNEWWRRKVFSSKLMDLTLNDRIFFPNAVNVAITIPANSVFRRYSLRKRAQSWSKGLNSIIRLLKQNEKSKKVYLHFFSEEPESLGSLEFTSLTYWLENITAGLVECSGQCAVHHMYPYDRPVLMFRHVLAADVIINTKSELGHIAAILSDSLSISLSHFWSYEGARNHVEYDEVAEQLDESRLVQLWRAQQERSHISNSSEPH